MFLSIVLDKNKISGKAHVPGLQGIRDICKILNRGPFRVRVLLIRNQHYDSAIPPLNSFARRRSESRDSRSRFLIGIREFYFFKDFKDFSASLVTWDLPVDSGYFLDEFYRSLSLAACGMSAEKSGTNCHHANCKIADGDFFLIQPNFNRACIYSMYAADRARCHLANIGIMHDA